MIQLNAPITSTKLYQRLLKVERDNYKLSPQVLTIVQHVSLLLTRIPEKMPEYTLHDESHSLKIVDIMGRIIPDETFEILNEVEISLLILSAYMHDIGMTCSTDEREDIIKNSNEYQILLQSNKAYADYLNFRSDGEHREATRIEDRVFTEYLRKNHVKRSSEYIVKVLSEGQLKFSLNDIPLYKFLINICDGHGEPIKSLKNASKWPRNRLIGQMYVNIQYLTVVLRLADILDLDPERTPSVIYDFVEPKDEMSIQEWRKHKSIVGWDISPERVVVEAECNFPEVERALRLFINLIELERAESINLLARDTDDISKKYKLTLYEPITTERIRSDDSYIYSDVKFELHYKKIMELLMGQKLYRNPITALRELIQNAIDAIKARSYIYYQREETFSPKIILRYLEGKLIIEDNGIGMDDRVFSEYFLQVGKSYYNEMHFNQGALDVVSEFGIGVLSVFMIAESMVVKSRMTPDNPLHPQAPIYYEIPTAHSFCVKRKCERTEIGTTIELSLKKDITLHQESFLQIIHEIIPEPPFPIDIFIKDSHFIHDRTPQTEIPWATRDMEYKNNTGDRWSVEVEKNLHYLFKIECTENIDLPFTGVLQVVNTETMNYYIRFFGFVTQRYFSIGSPENKGDLFSIVPTENLRRLFPNWVSIKSSINIFGENSLSLTPDRTEIIIDEKYNLLKVKLESIIINAFIEHLDYYKENNSFEEYCNYMDFLLSKGFLGISNPHQYGHLSKKSLEFFLDYIPFSVIKDNKIVKKFGREIMKKRYIGVIERNWSREYLSSSLNSISEDMEIIVMQEMRNQGYYRLDFIIDELFGLKNFNKSKDHIIVTSIPALAIDIFDREEESKIDIRNAVNKITSGILGDCKPILCIPSPNGDYYHIFNITHPVIEKLFENGAFKNDAAAGLFGELRENFRLSFRKFLKKIDSSDDIRWQRLLREDNHNLLSVNLFRNDPDQLDTFKNAIEILWKGMRKLKLVNEDDFPPEISTSDFPPYWY